MKKLNVNLSFTDAITQMPNYAKFLKQILTNKKDLADVKRVPINEECSAFLQNKLPQKLKDPGDFFIPCSIGNTKFKHALCDLGASVSLLPKSVFDRLGIGELKQTKISLQLADGSIKLPIGVLEDFPIQVGKFFVPVDFVVVDMKEDAQVPIILGRPFLATAGAIIDVKSGTLSLNFGKEK